MPDQVDRIRTAIGSRLLGFDSAVVAFSGGVDSSVVAVLAARTLGTRAVAVTAVSPALATGELDGARDVAARLGIAHEVVTTAELEREGYRRNGRDRCYHCKSELYEVLEALAQARGGATVLSGANADDIGDWRPGLRAAAEHGVLHPLLEAGATKAHVRELARRLEVPTAEKPASPCLASRLPYGTPVEPATLRRVDRAERAVRRLGYKELRVRHYGDVGRLELPHADLRRALDPDEAAAICDAIRSAGYTAARIDRRAFRSGRLNEPHPDPAASSL